MRSNRLRKQIGIAVPWHELLIVALIFTASAFVLLQPKLQWHLESLASTDVLQERWAVAYNTEKLRYPHLPEAALRQTADDRIATLTASGTLAQEIAERTAQYRAGTRDAEGVPYLTHPDAYLYLRYADEIREHGAFGIVDPETGAYVDYLRKAPTGMNVASNALPQLFVGIYRVLRVLTPKVTLSTAASLYPLLCAFVVLLLVYSLLRQGVGMRAAQFGTGILAVHAQFFAAFQWGYADTNALNILCGVILLAAAYALVECRATLGRIGIAGLAIATLALFRATWSGWIFFAGLSAGALAVMIALRLRENGRMRLLWSFSLLASVGAAVAAVRFHNLPLISTATQYFSSNSTGAFPNLFPYIGEFHALTPRAFLSALGTNGGLPIGGVLIIALFCVGVMQLLKMLRGKNATAAALLLLWALALAYPATRLRFLQFAIIPLAAICGIGAATLAEWGTVRVPHRWAAALSTSLLIVLLAGAVLPKTAAAVAAANPHMNDAMATIADAIRSKTPPGTIIATWWNEGYPYQYFARRGTYADGATFTDSEHHPYWVARYYLETDRNIARGILRSLSCNPYDLTALLNEVPGGIDNVNAVLQRDREQARAFLQTQVGGWAMEEGKHIRKRELLSNSAYFASALFCDAPRETVVVISENHLDLVWAFDWYRKVDPRDPGKANSGRSELNGALISCAAVGEKVFCEHGIAATSSTGKAIDKFGNSIPFFFNNGTHLYRPQEDVPPNRPVLILYIDGDRLRGALINSDILNSMLVKLLFFNGEGMPEYEKIAEASGRYQPRVVAYRVNFTAEI